MPNTSYAVMTKARSKFGKQLSEKDYNSLLSCHNVPEVMTYLKSYTHYSSTLRNVNERDVHRGMLEALLRQNLFFELDSLCRYDSSIGSGFSQYLIETIEVEQMIRFLILLHSNSTEKFIYQFPAYFTKHTEIDINKLANARNYDEFLNVLSSSQFYNILKNFKPDDNGILPISEIENKLYKLVFANLLNIINEKSSGQEKQELKEFFITLNDYNIFSRILRLKKYHSLSPETIKKNLDLEYTDIKSQIIDDMCKAESSAEVFAIMQNTNKGRLIDKIGYVHASDIIPRVKYRLAKKYMRFSNHPAVSMIAYMFAAEIELMNIICLIEGVRYDLDRKKIQSMLIY